MRHFSKNHTTVREIACWSVFLAKLSGANGSSWPSPGHPSSNPQVQNTYTTQVLSAGREKSTPLWLGATQEIVFIELQASRPARQAKQARQDKQAARQAGQAGRPGRPPPKIQNETPSKTHVKTLPEPSIWSHLGHNRGKGYFTVKFGP